MLLLRKIDYYIQFIIGTLMILSVPILFFYGFLAGLFILGCLQLLSAALNTPAYIANGFRKRITTYWMWTAIILCVLFLSFFLSAFFNPDDMQVPAWAAIVASVPLAIYYLNIYNKMILQISIKKKTNGLPSQTTDHE